MALVVNLTLPAFASDLITGSAFAVDERLLSVPRLAASASAPVGSSTDPYYVRPFTNGSATVYWYSWSNSNPNGSSSGRNQTFTNFADIVTHITSSIANSFLALGQRLHFDNDAIYGRLYDILTAIQHNTPSDVVKIADNSDNNFAQDYLWKKYLTAPNGSIPVITGGGRYSTTSLNFNNLSILGAIQGLLYYNQQSLSNGFNGLMTSVWNTSGFTPALTNGDLTTSDIDKGSLWHDTLQIGANLSDHLAHLRFVLANDDDIALRQSQHDNMETVRNDFTSGDVSVTPAKLGGLKSVGSALTDGLASSASVSDGLSVLGSGSDAWDWFTDENAQSFDSVSSSRNSMRMLKSGTGYLDQYYKDVMPYVD